MKTPKQILLIPGMLLVSLLLTGIACSSQSGNDSQTRSLWTNTSAAESRPDVRISSQGFPLQYGADVCAWSGKTLETVRYGGQIIMQDGTDLRFNSAENLALYYLNMEKPAEVQKLLAVDFAHGQKLLPVHELVYLNSGNRPSPGGKFITPVDASNERMRRYIHDAYPGTYLTWGELLEKLKNN